MSPKKKLILMSIIFLGTIVLLFLFVLNPLKSKVEESSEKYALVKQDLEMIESRQKELKGAKKNYEKVEGGLAIIKRSFVDPGAPVELLEFLEDSATEYGLSISISPYSFKEKKEESFWEEIGFQLSLGGSFSDFFGFLNKIEASSYLLEVQSLSINKISENVLRKEGEEELSKNDIRANLLIKDLTK
jgi:Tfp pilus assembly protein PilO